MSDLDRYAVFGNPVRQSKSPQIHAEFAHQLKQQIQYRAIKVEEAAFKRSVQGFFAGGGKGLNITVPYKEAAFSMAENLSDRAARARAVNTLWLDDNGTLCGDTTDGIGLMRDMIANHGWQVAGQRVLVLGAGGAVRGILEPLLREQPESLYVANRTVARAEELADHFADIGAITAVGFDALKGHSFDLIISGTSASLSAELPPLPDGILSEHGHCYDMVYASGPTILMRWAAEQAAWAITDGLGMLVEQAAESYYLWRGVRPDTGPVITMLRNQLQGQAA